MDDEDDSTCPFHEVLDDKLRVSYYKGYLAAVHQAIKCVYFLCFPLWHLLLICVIVANSMHIAFMLLCPVLPTPFFFFSENAETWCYLILLRS